MEIKASSVIGLHRLLIRRGRAGTYYVTRWGGRSQIATREAGITAIQGLKSRQSVEEIEKSLARNSNRPSLQPLLQALLNANLVRTIDGVAVSRPDFHPANFAKSLCRLYLLPGCFRLMKLLPARIHRWGLYAVTCLNSHRSLGLRASTAEANARTTSLQVPKHFRRQYLHHLLLNIADTEAVFTARPMEARRWLEQATVWHGFENIEKARSLGKGLILAGFHLSASRLLAPLLLSRGLNVHMTATPSPSVDIAESIRWHRDFCSVDPDAGEFHQIPQISPKVVKDLFGALSRNDVVLTFPDMHTINPNSDEATRMRCAFFGVASSPFKAPTIRIELAGVEARMNEWAGWLAAQSGSPVVPVVLVRAKSGRFVLTVSPPIVCPCSDDPAMRGAAVNRDLFQTLDRYVRAYPSQWFGWHRFHLQRVTT
jgi:lauroyl/myristoyl acyltransferase